MVIKPWKEKQVAIEHTANRYTEACSSALKSGRENY